MANIILTTVTGGYNGGAEITVKLNGTTVFTATGDSPYNLSYSPASGSFTMDGQTVNISITPPPNNTSALTITFSGGESYTLTVNHEGANTSYGYNFEDTHTTGGGGGGGGGDFDVNSPMYKINFIDGGFITVLNYLKPRVLEAGETDLLIPCFVFGDYQGSQTSVTKVDYNGNRWSFSENKVVINGTHTYQPQSGNRMWFDYDPSNNKLWISFPNGTAPRIEAGNDYTDALLYNSETGSTATIGDIIATGQEKYNAGGSYCVNNILPVSDGAPLPVHNYTAFIGRQSDGNLDSALLTGWGGTADNLTLDLSDSISDYDPIQPIGPGSDPYSPGGPSGPGGGGGTFSDTPDPIPFSTPPAISATDTGFCTLFATNIAGIQSVAAKLWTDLFDAIKPGGSLEGTVEALKSLVTSPYDAILGCTILPFHVNTTTAKSVKLYGVLDCGVSLPVAASQWQIVNCGYLDIEGTLKSYLDYSPYTKVTSIFLPYIGTVSIDVDAIMDKRLTIQYMVDILSGQCIAQIMIDNAVQAQYQGHCAVNVPVTSIDWSTTVNAGLGLVGNVANIVGSAAGGLAVSAAGLGAAAGAIAGQLPSMAQNVMGSKPDIKSGGGVGGAAGQMGGQKPVLIIERPRQSTPGIDTDNDGTVDLWQNHWTGYPSNIAVNLGTLEGYTEVARIFVNRTNATAEEKQEIERLLMEGVYF